MIIFLLNYLSYLQLRELISAVFRTLHFGNETLSHVIFRLYKYPVDFYGTAHKSKATEEDK